MKLDKTSTRSWLLLTPVVFELVVMVLLNLNITVKEKYSNAAFLVCVLCVIWLTIVAIVLCSYDARSFERKMNKINEERRKLIDSL